MTTVKQQITGQMSTEWYKIIIGCGIKRMNFGFQFLYIFSKNNWHIYIY